MGRKRAAEQNHEVHNNPISTAIPLVKRAKTSSGVAATQLMMADAAARPVPKYEVGAIQRIELTNFMCHQRLVYQPIPRINLIIGRNGAGKTSIVQAIVIGLGGAAKVAERGYETLKEFVRRGADCADIKITLCNAGQDAYRPATFKDAILFERSISSEGNVKHAVRSADGKVVLRGAEATREREAILQKFCIHLDNPTCILHQEMAKRFFVKWNGPYMYRLVEKSSLIRATVDLYAEARKEQQKSKEIYKMGESNLLKHLGERRSLERKLVRERKKRQQTDDEQIYLRKKVGEWMLQKQCEKAEEAERKVAQVDQLMASELAKVERIDNDLADAREQVRRGQLGSAKIEQRISELDDDLNNQHKLLVEARIKKVDADRSFNRLEEELRSAKVSAQKSKNKLLKARRDKNGVDVDRKQVVDRLQAEKEDLERSVHELGISDLEEEKSKIKSKLAKLVHGKRQKLNDANEYRKQKESLLGRIVTLKNQSLGRFGREMSHLVNAIRNNRNKFKSPPVGPVGEHIKLKGGEVAANNKDLTTSLLEVAVGRALLSSFVVANRSDRDALNRLTSKIYGRSRRPVVYTRDASAKAYGLARGRVLPSPAYKCVLDYLEFTSDTVFNLVVDMANVESVLVLSQEMGQRLFSSAASVPRNAKSAVTFDFYRFYPPTGTQSYSSYYMNAPSNNEARILCEDTAQEEKRLLEQVENMDKMIGERQADSQKLQAEVVSWEKQLRQIGNKVKERRAEVDETLSRLQSLEGELIKRNLEHRDADALDVSLKDAEERCRRLTEQRKEAIERRKDAASVHDRQSQACHNIANKRLELRSQLQSFGGGGGDGDHLGNDTVKLEAAKEKSQRLLVELRTKRRKYAGIKSDLDEQIKVLIVDLGCRASKKQTMTKEEFETFHARLKVLGDEKDKSVTVEDRDKLNDLKAVVQRETKKLEVVKEDVERLEGILEERRTQMGVVCNYTFRHIRLSFQEGMTRQKLKSEIFFDKEAGVKVKVNDKDPDKLSGGEKSKTMVCFVTGLWNAQHSPFRCLDEWDVGLDDSARPKIEEMLVSWGKDANYQCFFISPTKPGVGSAIKVRDCYGDSVQVLNVGK